eukprot:scaffold295831_cov36-Tisochrysis_lutea.AAC.1
MQPVVAQVHWSHWGSPRPLCVKSAALPLAAHSMASAKRHPIARGRGGRQPAPSPALRLHRSGEPTPALSLQEAVRPFLYP